MSPGSNLSPGSIAVLADGSWGSPLACGVGRWTYTVVETYPSRGLPSLPGLMDSDRLVPWDRLHWGLATEMPISQLFFTLLTSLLLSLTYVVVAL